MDRDSKISFSEWMEHFNWDGEGDDMIFIDGEPFPPSLHGTGTEDYFNTAYCPAEKYSAPYHGVTLPGGPNWSGQISLYRFHIEDPIMFDKSIKVTIEHGHDSSQLHLGHVCFHAGPCADHCRLRSGRCAGPE